MPHTRYHFMPTSSYAPTPAHPLKSKLSYDYLSTTDEVCIKRWLFNRLRDPGNGLPHMPGGFPFHYRVDGCGRGGRSYEPYEFCEEIPSNILSMSGPQRRYWITFSFTSHHTNYDKSHYGRHGVRSSPDKARSYMSWRAYLTVRDMSYYRSNLLNLPLLHIELDSTVLNTSYGHLFKSDPRIVLRAMGVSLDKGMPITIKLADSAHPWEILFLGTDGKGERHLLHTSKLRESQDL
ncbi:hypothetical protein C8F04DRAFT_1360239 [Mycena alexandri]|uniref:Uncharacterized protein n=1 Tax=Mycena alexandri TaxID=1745969 RepID=A0AAD6SRY5_9AGAR|nr:hypothetical protein C8F04DRAFT_1360239 [Mycena alexandri]